MWSKYTFYLRHTFYVVCGTKTQSGRGVILVGKDNHKPTSIQTFKSQTESYFLQTTKDLSDFVVLCRVSVHHLIPKFRQRLVTNRSFTSNVQITDIKTNNHFRCVSTGLTNECSHHNPMPQKVASHKLEKM